MRTTCSTCLLLGILVVSFVQHVHSAYDRQSRDHRRRPDRGGRHGRKHAANRDVTMTTTVSSVSHEQVSDEYEYKDYGNVETSPIPYAHVTSTRPKLTKEQYRARVRAMELRRLKIQLQILHTLQATNLPPNETVKVLTAEDELTLREYISNKTINTKEMAHAHMFRFASPECDLPPKTHKSWWDKNFFRLYFKPSAPENELLEFKLSSAVLRLNMKNHNGECNWRSVLASSNNTGRSRSRDMKQRRGNSGAARYKRSGLSQRSASQIKGRRRRKAGKGKNSSKNHRPSWTDRREENNKRHIRITISSFQRPLKKNKKIRKQTEVSEMIDEDHLGWIEINIRSLVEQWINRPRKNFGLEVEVEDDHNNRLDPFQIFEYVDCDKHKQQDAIYINLTTFDEAQLHNTSLREEVQNFSMPNLQMTFAEKVTKVDRRKRDVSETCVLENIFVSFQELGLSDYILAPQGLEAAYCQGHCLPLRTRENYDVSNNLDSETNAPRACCGPTKFRPFRFLHYSGDSKRLTVSSVDNFIVAECGCRE